MQLQKKTISEDSALLFKQNNYNVYFYVIFSDLKGTMFFL